MILRRIERGAATHSRVFVRTGLAIGLVLWLTAPGSGRAGTCPPAARLRGDPAAVAGVTSALGARGIATDPAACRALEVSLERRDGALLVSTASEGDQIVERAVTDIRTAATVIESWVRTDVEAPLLATRTIAVREPPAAPPPAAAPAIAVAPRPPERGVQLFTTAETTRASDRTSWFGLQVGACVMLGPVCAAARARFASVTGGPGPWQGGLDRHGVEVLLGGDVPLRWGRATISPGVAAGVGSIHTREEGSTFRGGETGGLRAEAHAALSYPLRPRIALEVTLALDLTQATHVETSSPVPLPDEPRLLARLGLGLRFGGL